MFLDVENLDKSEFTSKGWSQNFLKDSDTWFSNCNNNKFFGGYNTPKNNIGNGKNNSVWNTFLNLPTHFEVTLRFRFFFIDSWDEPDYL